MRVKRIFALAIVLIMLAAFAPTGVYARSTLPSIHITMDYPSTFNRTYPIHRREWRDAEISMTGSAYDFSFTPMRIRGRGNSSWWSMGYKLPYRFRFPSGYARSMMGSEHEARDWVLIANAHDYSHMRNYAAFYLGRMLNFEFTSMGQHVHLYINGDYRGVYLLADQMQVLPGRIQLSRSSDPTRSEYLIELCGHTGRNPDATDPLIQISRIMGGERFDPRTYVIGFPSGNRLTDEHIEFVQNFVQDVYNTIHRGNFQAVSEIIDLPSFIDSFLVHELFKEMDVNWSSMRFTIRQTDTGPRLFAGPIWDFDLSAGGDGGYNSNNAYRYGPYGSTATWNRWFGMLMRTEWFAGMVSQRWDEIRDNEVRDMLDHINALARTYRRCFERNFERWPDKLGNNIWRISRPALQRDTFMGQIEWLDEWFERRIVWMNDDLRDRPRPRPLP